MFTIVFPVYQCIQYVFYCKQIKFLFTIDVTNQWYQGVLH